MQECLWLPGLGCKHEEQSPVGATGNSAHCTAVGVLCESSWLCPPGKAHRQKQRHGLTTAGHWHMSVFGDWAFLSAFDTQGWWGKHIWSHAQDTVPGAKNKRPNGQIKPITYMASHQQPVVQQAVKVRSRIWWMQLLGQQKQHAQE